MKYIKGRTPEEKKEAYKKYRWWDVTINNWTEDDKLRIENCGCDFFVYGEEIAPTTGTPHLQGFVGFKYGMTRSMVSREFPRGSARPARNLQKLWEYCQKGNNVVKHGELPLTPKQKGEQERQRWEVIWDCAKLGAFKDIDAKVRVCHYNKLKQIQRDYMHTPLQIEKCSGIWIYGPAGAGKTTKAYEVGRSFGAESETEIYLKAANKWWDGYQNQKTVIVDDLDPGHACLRQHLKQWLDKFPFKAEVKGGGMDIRPECVIVTSQYSIDEMFCGDQKTIDALKRRCEIIFLPFVYEQVKCLATE